MNDKMTEYYEAYYGAPIPLSQANRIEKTFTEMVKTIKADIENHIPSAETSAVKAGIIEALLVLNASGDVNSPDLYLRSQNHANTAFRYAIAAANGKPLKRERTPKEAAAALAYEREATKAAIDAQRKEDEEMAKTLEERSPISASIHRYYNSAKSNLIMNGENDSSAKVKAYIALLDWWENQGGVDYYIVAWKIPHEQGIYDTQEVIDAQNAHYALPNREGPTRMRVNGKKWDGLK